MAQRSRNFVDVSRDEWRENVLTLQGDVMRFVSRSEDVKLFDIRFQVLIQALKYDLRGLTDEHDLDAGIFRLECVAYAIGGTLRIVGSPPNDRAFFFRGGVKLRDVGIAHRVDFGIDRCASNERRGSAAGKCKKIAARRLRHQTPSAR